MGTMKNKCQNPKLKWQMKYKDKKRKWFQKLDVVVAFGLWNLKMLSEPIPCGLSVQGGYLVSAGLQA